MYSIMYISEVAVPISHSELSRIAERANINNKEMGITGYLYYSNKRFIQYLEGHHTDLSSLMALIRSDFRHTVLYTTDSRSIHHRHFPDWNMKAIDSQSATYQHLTDYMRDLNENPDFDLMTMPATKELVEELLWKHLEQVRIPAQAYGA